MAYCTHCGAELEDGAKFCPACGAATDGSASNGAQSKDFAEPFNHLNDTADTTGEYDSQDIEANKVFSILAYIGLLFLVPLLAAPNSKFARFHTNQGLVLFIADVILSVIASLCGFIPFVGWIVSLVCGLACLVFMILGIINAANGRAKELPLMGHIRLLK